MSSNSENKRVYFSEVSRAWFDFAFERKECTHRHTALYFWILELNNRLGWKTEFGLPSNDTMEGLSMSNKNAYLSTLRDLAKWGFIEIVQEAKNQFQSCIISVCYIKYDTAQYTALDTALIQHNTKHRHDTIQSIDTIDKQVNKLTSKQVNNNIIVADRDAQKEEVFEGGFEPEKIEAKSNALEEEKKEKPSKKVARKKVSEKSDPIDVENVAIHAGIKEVVHQRLPGYYWQAKDGKATNELIKKIRYRYEVKNGKPPDVRQAIYSFQYVLENLPDFWKNKWDVMKINSQFESIVNQIISPQNGNSSNSQNREWTSSERLKAAFALVDAAHAND